MEIERDSASRRSPAELCIEPGDCNSEGLKHRERVSVVHVEAVNSRLCVQEGEG